MKQTENENLSEHILLHTGEILKIELQFLEWWNPFNWKLGFYCKKCKKWLNEEAK